MALVWIAHLEGGPQRVNHAAARVGSYIYSFGGYSTGENFEHPKPMDIHVLCTVTNRWKSLPTPTDPHEIKKCVPYQRYGHTACAYGTKIYIWGGRNDSAACNRLFCYDTVSQKWSCPTVKGSIPGARDGHAACIINDKMYITGGFIDHEQFAEGLHALDLTTMTWFYIQTKSGPSYRDFLSATAIDGKIYVFGGRGDVYEPYHTGQETYDNTLYMYDPQTNDWAVKEDSQNAPVGRRSLSTFAHNHRLYIFGGYNGLKKAHYNDLYYYDTIRNKWSGELNTLGNRPCKRRRQTCIAMGGRVYLFGGTSPGSDFKYVESDDEESDTIERGLVDLNDLFILDLNPSLKTLCLVAVINYKLDVTELPKSIRMEILWMTQNNNISKPLSRPCTG